MKHVNLSCASTLTSVDAFRNWEISRCASWISGLDHWAIWLVMPATEWYCEWAYTLDKLLSFASTAKTLPGFVGVFDCFFLKNSIPNLSITCWILTGCVKRILCFFCSTLHPMYSLIIPSGVFSVVLNSFENSFALWLTPVSVPENTKQSSTYSRNRIILLILSSHIRKRDGLMLCCLYFE